MTENDPTLVTELRTSLLPVLSEYGFELRVLEYTPKSFGNCVVELSSTNAVLTVTQDRGQVFVDVSNPQRPAHKYWLGELVAFLEGEPNPRPLTTLREAVTVLAAAHRRLLSPELLVARSAELAAYREAFNERRWGRHRPSPNGAS